MTLNLSLKAQEGSSYTIFAEFNLVASDGTTVATTPTLITWSLHDQDGNVINNRLDVPVTPDTSVSVTLSGDDLALNGDYPAKRFFTMKGKYDSLFGNNLDFLDEVEFQVENLVGKS